jgi:hypothetical protein
MTDKDLSGDAVELVENGCSVPPSWPEAIRRGFETMGVEDVTVVVTTDAMKERGLRSSWTSRSG